TITNRVVHRIGVISTVTAIAMAPLGETGRPIGTEVDPSSVLVDLDPVDGVDLPQRASAQIDLGGMLRIPHPPASDPHVGLGGGEPLNHHRVPLRMLGLHPWCYLHY